MAKQTQEPKDEVPEVQEQTQEPKDEVQASLQDCNKFLFQSLLGKEPE